MIEYQNIDEMPRGGPNASWLNRKMQTKRLEFLDRDDIDDQKKRAEMEALDRMGERFSLHKKFTRIALEAIGNVSAPKVLELGAGHGALSSCLLQEHATAELTVSDVNPGLVEHMRAGELGKHPRAAVRVIDATAIDAPDQSYDLAIFAMSLHHLPPSMVMQTIAEATRVAKKFLVIDIMRRSVFATFAGLAFIVPISLVVDGFPVTHDYVISSFRAYSPSAVRALAERLGHDVRLRVDKRDGFQVFLAERGPVA